MIDGVTHHPTGPGLCIKRDCIQTETGLRQPPRALLSSLVHIAVKVRSIVDPFTPPQVNGGVGGFWFYWFTLCVFLGDRVTETLALSSMVGDCCYEHTRRCCSSCLSRSTE